MEQYNKLDYSMPKMPAPREDRSEGYPRFAQQKLKLKLRPPPRPNKHRPAGQGPSKMLTFKKRIPTSDLKGPLDFVDEYNQDPDKALKKYDKFSKKNRTNATTSSATTAATWWVPTFPTFSFRRAFL